MARLGEILIERGAISTDALRSGLEACRRHGGRLGTWLVRLGFLKETTLLDALAEQTGCPPATTLDLATVPPQVRNLIPHAFAQRNLVVAFGRRGRALDVAMVNPNDLLLVDEIAGTTGLVVRPHVATEAALTAALALAPPTAETSTGAPPPGPPRTRAREWRHFWTMAASPAEAFRALDAAAPETPGHAAATFPGLAPLGAVDDLELDTAGPDDLEDLTDGLATARHRNNVAVAVLSYLSQYAPRVALFSLHQRKIMGWQARGLSVVEEDFASLILPLDRPSVFLNMGTSDLHLGPLGGGDGNDLLKEALGPPAPAEAVIVPLKVRSKPVGYLWLDAGDEPVGTVPIPVVREVAHLAGLALEALVLRQKIRTTKGLTPAAAPD